jgi:hypothetical protein
MRYVREWNTFIWPSTMPTGGSHKDCKGLSFPLKGKGFLYQLRDYEISRKDCVPWRWLGHIDMEKTKIFVLQTWTRLNSYLYRRCSPPDSEMLKHTIWTSSVLCPDTISIFGPLCTLEHRSGYANGLNAVPTVRLFWRMRKEQTSCLMLNTFSKYMFYIAQTHTHTHTHTLSITNKCYTFGNKTTVFLLPKKNAVMTFRWVQWNGP